MLGCIRYTHQKGNVTLSSSFTDVFGDEIPDSQPISLPSSADTEEQPRQDLDEKASYIHPTKGTGQIGSFRSAHEIAPKYRHVFTYQYFNLVQSGVIDDALYTDKSLVVCAPTGSGKTVVFEMAIVHLLMEIENKNYTENFKIIYMAPVKALCTERITEWHSKFNKLGLLCIEVTGDTDVDFDQLQPYKIIITTPEKWDMLTRRWRDHRGLVEMVKLFLIDEVHILNDKIRGPVLESVVSRMKAIESAAQSAYRIEKLQEQYQISNESCSKTSTTPPRIRFIAVSATVSNPEDVAAWLGKEDKPAVFYKYGDECRPVKINRVVEGYPCPDGTSIFKFDIILNYKLWPIIQKYHNGKPTLIFCNTRKSVLLTAETLSREITITFNPEQKAKLTALASTIKNKKLQALVLAGVGCHHAGMLYEERFNIEHAFRNRDLPILITTTTLAMGVNLPAHLVIVKNTQQYVNGAYQEYSISTVLQMLGRAGRPQFDTEATAVIMTRQRDKARYQALVEGTEPLQSYLHMRLAENLNSEAALGTVGDVAQCVQWLHSTFLYVRAAKDPKRYLGLSPAAPYHQISKKIEEMCVRAMNSLASSGLITMDDASCITSTDAGRLMSVYYLDLETMKLIMKIQGDETLEQLLSIICESHELADMHLRVDERRCLNTLNRNNTAATIRYPMKGKINSRQMKLNCIIQAVLGCLPIPDPSLNQEAMKIMRIAARICKCLVAYVTRHELISEHRQFFSTVLNSITLAKCVEAHLWDNSPYVSKQLKGIGPTFSMLLASAGKVNFFLLEESHPRDLERILNKGPPAGNILRKQISLLPKYQIEAMPLDEKTVSFRLLLINQTYLSENMGNLTAGDNHKCYVVAGDSNNHILLFNTFKDKDLISLFDGVMVYDITRRHTFEHKIFIHCISSTFVGIDAHCEYTFKNLMPMVLDPPSIYCKNKDIVQKVTETNKSNIKERKRKNYSDELIESKEKKKRESAKAEKYRLLKESYEKTSKEIECEEKSKILHNTPDKIVTTNVPNLVNRISVNEDTYNEPFDDLTYLESNIKDFDTESVENKKIDSILNEIENEMKFINQGALRGVKKGTSSRNNKQTTMNPYKNKQGHNFIDLLEKNIEFSEDDEMQEKENGFSEAIKKQVDKYLQSRYDPVVSDPLLADIVNEHDFETSQSPESKLKSHDKSTERGNVENIIDTINPVTENQTVTNISAAVNKNNVEELVCNKAVTEKTANEKVLDEIHTEQLTNEKFMNRQEEQYSRVELNNNQQGKFVSHNKKIQLTQNNNSNYLALLEGKNYSTSYNIDDNYNETEEYKRVNVTDDTIKSKNNKNDHEASNHHNILLKAAITNDVDEIKCDKAKSLQSPPLSKISKYEHNAHFSSSSHNQPRKKQENKYKFSTEKIDIRSKFCNENEIHIIRKLRIDIGITETILENKVPSDCSAPLNQENVYEKNTVKNKSLIPIEYNANREQLNDFEQDKNNDVQERNIINENVENIQYYKHDTITENIKTNKKETAMDGMTTVDYNKLNNCMNTNTNIEGVLNKYSKAHLNQENAYENNKTLIPIDYNASVYDMNNDTHERNITDEKNFKNTENNIHDNITDNSKTIKEERVMDGIPTNNNNNEPNNSMNTKTNIESVLKKYSKVFSNRYKNVRTPSVQNLNYKESKPMKPNKPFKITDIQNLNIQLNNLCDSPKSTNTIAKSEIDKLTITNKNTLEVKKEKPNQLFTMTEIENRNVPKNNFFESLKSTSYTTIGEIEKEEIQDRIAAKPFEEDEFEEDTINDNILSLQCTTLNEVDDLKEEFDVDHAMLNPKTLLKCYDRDDYYNTDIIPPPPEFSDNTYSPKLDDYLANNCFQENLLHIKSDCIGPQHDFSKNELNEHKTDSMYKETETWTLDNDDDVTEYDYFIWNHIHDYNDGNNIERYVYPNTVSLKQRHGKLHQFKFHRKNKYNPKP